jgi:hypothetical protein
MQATFSPDSRDCSWRVAMAAISGIWKAMAGTRLAYSSGIFWVPLAEKLPTGTAEVSNSH